MFQRLLLVITLLIFSLHLNAGSITVTGVYHGKNLIVQNPFTETMKEFCTSEVFVNEVKILTEVQSSAFEINLSHLKINDPVTVKIIHKENCQPKILNSQVIEVHNPFSFHSLTVSLDQIYWYTKGEKVKGRYLVEHYSHNSWVPVDEVPVFHSSSLSKYESRIFHHSGLNKYRIKYIAPDGKAFLSTLTEFNSTLSPVEFYPKRVIDVIHLSRPAPYEIIDDLGNVVKKGNEKDIKLLEFKSGVYYLSADNQTFKFWKK